MLGDVLLINDLHKRAAVSIHNSLNEIMEAKKNGYKYIVAISGESGAGKSELSHSLALLIKADGKRVKVLHTDNYYKVPPTERTEWRKKNGVSKVGVNEYDWKLLNRNIKEFREGREALMPCIDIISQQTDKLITDFSVIDVLVVDGLYAIKTKGIDLKIFIDLTYHETKMERVVRGKELMDEFRSSVLEMEHQNLLKLKPSAQLIVNKNYDVVLPER
ncbi:MAG: uridine kinase [Bacteroidetes bacterium]|jgi:uridine kinase|nr:uridine kinase [Bacteroidota bacterium]MBT3748568.1 uridine kinase [Bacteroidota bacterium]MBT4402203.1 uridine kinase [Bacteroidota bacterium]MBT4410754.1 uridine kinase [Bacteroidota bacterium]MBT5425504.1 uridine kinase [Bacteroidota bacterium]